MSAGGCGRLVRSYCLALGLLMANACAHKLPAPPVAPRVVTLTRSYLLDKPLGVTGNTQRVVDGVWCAGDHAFSLPVVPFPDGPTELYGDYYDGGITGSIDMLDRHESVLEIARTKIRPELRPGDVLPHVASKQEGTRRLNPLMTVEWIEQRGTTQIQVINPAVDYSGRDDITFLTSGQGWSNQKDGCRVDRHFVGAGYYFQIIAVAHQPERPGGPKPERESCEIALELAAWTAENIRVGATCGVAARASSP